MVTLFDFDNKIFCNMGKKYNLVYLNDIDLTKMTLVKNRQTKSSDLYNMNRSVYLDLSTNLFYKVWDVDNMHVDKFLHAIRCNFFDNNLIKCFYGIIFDTNKKCRGYIMHKGSETDKNIFDIPELYDLLKLKIKETSLFHDDPVSRNIVKYFDDYSLIDLEEIYPIDSIVLHNNVPHVKMKHDMLYKIKPTEYANFLWGYINTKDL